MVQSLILSTASSITNRGTRNHSRGAIGRPKRSLISRSRQAGPKDTMKQIFKPGAVNVVQTVGGDDIHVCHEESRVEPSVGDASRYIATCDALSLANSFDRYR